MRIRAPQRKAKRANMRPNRSGSARRNRRGPRTITAQPQPTRRPGAAAALVVVLALSSVFATGCGSDGTSAKSGICADLLALSTLAGSDGADQATDNADLRAAEYERLANDGPEELRYSLSVLADWARTLADGGGSDAEYLNDLAGGADVESALAEVDDYVAQEC